MSNHLVGPAVYVKSLIDGPTRYGQVMRLTRTVGGKVWLFVRWFSKVDGTPETSFWVQSARTVPVLIKTGTRAVTSPPKGKEAIDYAITR